MFLSTNGKDKKQAPEFSRRLFIGRLGAIFAGSTLLSSGILSLRKANASFYKTGDRNMSSSKNEFSPYVGDYFQIVTQEEKSIDVKLTEVTDRSPRVNGADKGKRQECFSMIFQGPVTEQLAQSTYAFKHKKMGQFDLFIVPIGKNETAIEYEAVINRLVG